MRPENRSSSGCRLLAKVSKGAYDKLPTADLDALVALSQEPSKAVACTAAIERPTSRSASGKWQTESERRALAYSGALARDRAAMQLRELLHDG